MSGPQVGTIDINVISPLASPLAQGANSAAASEAMWQQQSRHCGVPMDMVVTPAEGYIKHDNNIQGGGGAPHGRGQPLLITPQATDIDMNSVSTAMPFGRPLQLTPSQSPMCGPGPSVSSGAAAAAQFASATGQSHHHAANTLSLPHGAGRPIAVTPQALAVSPETPQSLQPPRIAPLVIDSSSKSASAAVGEQKQKQKQQQQQQQSDPEKKHLGDLQGLPPLVPHAAVAIDPSKPHDGHFHAHPQDHHVDCNKAPPPGSPVDSLAGTPLVSPQGYQGHKHSVSADVVKK